MLSRVWCQCWVNLSIEGLFVNGAEFILAYAAERANPVFGEFFEWGAWLNAVVGITYCGIVLVAADVTYILFHNVIGFKREVKEL